MNATMKAKIVTVKVEQGSSGAYFATSPELKGLQVARMSLAEIQHEIPRAITVMYAASGVDVVVSPVEDDGDEIDHRWVAVPSAIAGGAAAEA